MNNHHPFNTGLAAWLVIYNAPQIGPMRFKRLLKRFGSAEEVLQATPTELKHVGLSESSIAALKNPHWQLIERQIEWSQCAQQTILTWQDALYPPLLLEIAQPPPVLFVRGDCYALQRTQIALVGSRNPSPHGISTAFSFAQELSRTDLVITSGLALGVDAAAHRGALSVEGQTIAVLGSGLNDIYPAQHRKLAEQISQQGALVSEFSPWEPPRAIHFLQRNRLISGLSIGLLVVEAAPRSGSLITAQYAVDQGREVFAIPGSIHHGLAYGCHNLIQNGAKLTTKVADILDELQFFPTKYAIIVKSASRPALGKPQQKTPKISSTTQNHLDHGLQILLECVGFAATSVDSLVSQAGMTAQRVMIQLMELELQGYIQKVPVGYIRLM